MILLGTSALVRMLKEAGSYYAATMVVQESGNADTASTFWTPKGRRTDMSPKTISYLTNKQLLAVLVRLPRSDHANLAKVCKRWDKTVCHPDFWRARQACSLTGHSCLEQTVLALAWLHSFITIS